jgi:hypothetical protein
LIVVFITVGEGFDRLDYRLPFIPPIAFPPIDRTVAKMKGALLTAAVLLGSANGAVHKMKLQKVPLSEQLVCCASISVDVSGY